MKKVLLGLFAILSITAFSSVGKESPKELSSAVKYKILKRVLEYVNHNAHGKIDDEELKDIKDKYWEADLEYGIESGRPNPVYHLAKKVYNNVSDNEDIKEEIINIQNDIDLINTDIYKNKEKISENKEYINQLVENDSRILEQFREIGTEVSRNQKELQHGVSMVAAMDAAGFSNLSEGDLEVATGVATYAGKQAVAVGVAYAPSDVFSMNAKVGVNFGKNNKWAASAGARYKFNFKK